MYSVFYLLWFSVLLGVFLSLFGFDLLAGIFWLTESVVCYISILFVFYLNIFHNSNKNNKQIITLNHGLISVFSVISTVSFVMPSENEFYLPNELNIIELWDDFYEANSSFVFNDLFGFFVAFYELSTMETIFLGVYILYSTTSSANLNKLTRTFKITAYDDFLQLFDFFKDFVSFIFLRKQNLSDQARAKAATRAYNRKKLKL